MTLEIDKLQGIVDIIPPSTPITHQGQSLLIIVIIFSLLLILIFLLSLRYYSARGKALRKLKELDRALHQTHTENFCLPSQLATVLREGLRLRQLTTHTALPVNLLIYQDRWNLFIEQLTEACYAKKMLEIRELEILLNDAKFWIGRWP